MKSYLKSALLVLAGLAGVGWVIQREALLPASGAGSKREGLARDLPDVGPGSAPQATAPSPGKSLSGRTRETGLPNLAASSGTAPPQSKQTAARPQGTVFRPPSLPVPARLRGAAPGARPGLEGTPHAGASGSTVMFDLPFDAALPAIAAAPEEPESGVSPAAALAADHLMKEFVREVSGTGAGIPEGSTGADPAPEASTSGENWRSAVKLADDRFRTLYGKEAYLRQSMQAARALSESPKVP